MTNKELEQEGQYQFILEATKAIDILIKTVREVIDANEPAGINHTAPQAPNEIECSRRETIQSEGVCNAHSECLS